MSEDLLNLVLQKKLTKTSLDMTKIQIKSEKLTSFGGIFPIMEKFDRMLSRTIDSILGLRSKVYGYQYSEIIRSLMCVYFCGGSCVEDVTSHLMEALCLHPHLRTCSADTILRAIRELTTPNLAYRSDSGKSYDFYVASDLNNLLVNALLATGQLLPNKEYDFDFDHQFIETEKFDAKMTYKKFTGYSPGIATVGDGNTNARFHQEDTLKRIFERLENAGIHINRARMDCGSCSEAIAEMVEKTSRFREVSATSNIKNITGCGFLLYKCFFKPTKSMFESLELVSQSLELMFESLEHRFIRN